MENSRDDQPGYAGRWRIIVSLIAFSILVLILYNILEYVWW
ncbi:hypothetical protein [Dyadobacter frigoris]|nr:hypothetical protein [Dyadobacter frigoris]